MKTKLITTILIVLAAAFTVYAQKTNDNRASLNEVVNSKSTYYKQSTNTNSFSSFTDSRDGQSYETISVYDSLTSKTYTLMIQNLNYKLSSGCWAYNNEEQNRTKYGLLYTKESAILACPSGWRLPTMSDMFYFLSALGKNTDSKISLYLKLNAFRKNGLGGFYEIDTSHKEISKFKGKDYLFSIWLNTDYDALQSYILYSNMIYEDIFSSYKSATYNRLNGFPVRCIKDGNSNQLGNNKSFEEQYKLCENLMKNSNKNELKTQLKIGVEQFPYESWFVKNLINYEIADQNYTQALKYIDILDIVEGLDDETIRVKGNIFEQMNKYTEAIDQFKEIYENNDTSKVALDGLSRTYYNYAISLQKSDVKKSNELFAKSLEYFEILDKINPTESTKKALNSLYKILGKESLLTDKNDINQEIPALCFVEGGTFMMGDNEGEDSSPAHSVTLSNFSMSKYEITVKQYRDFCNATNRAMPEEPTNGWQDTNPITNVTYNDCVEYCKWLSQKSGGYWRLPTEAEWEFVAREGNKGGTVKLDNSEENSNTVKISKPNKLGIYNLLDDDNYEWCRDIYSETYYQKSTQQNPLGPNVSVPFGGDSIVYRGYYVMDRSYRHPFEIDESIGFRVVKSDNYIENKTISETAVKLTNPFDKNVNYAFAWYDKEKGDYKSIGWYIVEPDKEVVLDFGVDELFYYTSLNNYLPLPKTENCSSFYINESSRFDNYNNAKIGKSVQFEEASSYTIEPNLYPRYIDLFNDTKYKARVAIAWFNREKQDWLVRGWYEIEPGATRVMDWGVGLLKYEYYTFASFYKNGEYTYRDYPYFTNAFFVKYFKIEYNWFDYYTLQNKGVSKVQFVSSEWSGRIVRDGHLQVTIQ